MTSTTGPIIFPVKDLARAKTLYGKLLGVPPAVDAPYYVQFNAGAQEIGLDPNGHSQGMTGPVVFWPVDDIGASVKQLLDAGAEPLRPIGDVGGGKLVAIVKDADGNCIGLTQSG
jgi:predicted enzyme related to lactoylglutathione lyase